MRFYTVESLSANQELTPEGYLLIKDVRIARTGVMLYAAGEVPVAAVDGLIRIERSPEEVFAENTIASFEGKPLCINHPSEDVSPANWSSLAKGILQNVRRGAGLDDEFLVADLLVTSADAIDYVRAKKPEVSCGYDADYEETKPGWGRQANILGNHLAFVEEGRCGSRCAIGDSMKKIKLIDRLRGAFKSRDEAAFEEGLKEAETMDGKPEDESKKDDKKDDKEDEKKTSDAIAKIGDRLDAIDKRLNSLDKKSKDEDEDEEESDEEKKKKKDDADKKTDDSAALAVQAQDAIARAEILSPGLHFPTVDAKLSPEKFRDAICGLKRKALSQAHTDGKFRDAVAPFGNPEQFKSMTCDAIAAAFIGASEIARRQNNSAAATFDAGANAKQVANSLAEINRKNAEFWTKRS